MISRQVIDCYLHSSNIDMEFFKNDNYCCSQTVQIILEEMSQEFGHPGQIVKNQKKLHLQWWPIEILWQ